MAETARERFVAALRDIDNLEAYALDKDFCTTAEAYAGGRAAARRLRDFISANCSASAPVGKDTLDAVDTILAKHVGGNGIVESLERLITQRDAALRDLAKARQEKGQGR